MTGQTSILARQIMNTIIFSPKEYRITLAIVFTTLTLTFLTASWWKMHSRVVEFLSAVFACFNRSSYLEYHRTEVPEGPKGKKWSVHPFQTLKVQEMEYTYSWTNFRNYEKNNLGYKEQNLHKIGFTLVFWNEHRWNLIFFLAWHVIESLLHEEESSLIFSAKKLICIGVKSVPRTACLLSEVNKYTAELSFGSSRNTLSRRAQMSTEICIKLFTRWTIKCEIDDVPSRFA